MIIDNLPENFKLQPNNGFGIRTWNEDIKDTQLYDLGKILKGKINNIYIHRYLHAQGTRYQSSLEEDKRRSRKENLKER